MAKYYLVLSEDIDVTDSEFTLSCLASRWLYTNRYRNDRNLLNIRFYSEQANVLDKGWVGSRLEITGRVRGNVSAFKDDIIGMIFLPIKKNTLSIFSLGN